ncbi:hypothetical protein H4W26_001946 [Nesterenkonia halotolerans]|uniref:Uncharacterized protein n=1 Tax=Nesterenkonia halotolerans TaxID=225325 RepID=A0ABR9J870_9MICC|nr:hypothetical protein [Nesterenkonia halotolerans]
MRSPQDFAADKLPRMRLSALQHFHLGTQAPITLYLH